MGKDERDRMTGGFYSTFSILKLGYIGSGPLSRDNPH